MKNYFKFVTSHPIWSMVSFVVATALGIAVLIEPAYFYGPNGEICGYTETVEETTHPDKWKSCENINKVIGYKYTETVEKSSGWIGGGKNPQWHCNNVKREKERAVGESIVWGEPIHSEESKKDFLGNVTYNYHCKIEAKWSPVYKVERHEACGPADPVVVITREPKSCLDKTKRMGWKWKWE